MLKAGVSKCVYFYFREEIKKKRLPVVLWHFACLSFDGAASTLQSSWSSSRVPKSGVRSYMEKNCWNSAGDCFSLALLPLCSTQNGRFESERPKNLFWDVLFGHPPWLALSTVQDISLSQLSSSLDYVISVELSANWCRFVHLSYWGALHSLSQGKTEGLYCNIICHITASYLGNRSYCSERTGLSVYVITPVAS